MDFPRLDNGNLDPSFDDYYIVCKNNIKIRHGYNNILSCYIPSYGRGMNVLRKIFNDKIKPFDKEEHTNEFIAKELIDNSVLVDLDILTDEIYFTFKSDLLDYVAEVVGASTYGAKTPPLSPKNLPKERYIIPEPELDKYKAAIDNLPKVTRILHGKEYEMVNGLVIRSLISRFDNNIQKSKGKNFDIDADRKKKCIKGKEYIHSIGMWEEFVDYLKNEITIE